jgi:hydroxymethylpyrimidine pyrophosphatase-like HAD family hydrolase
MIIAVDFDGTIVDHEYPKIGKTKLFAFETLKQLEKDGHKLILWTFRKGELLEEAVKFCEQNGVKFYAVNSSFPDEPFDPKNASRKIAADLFIDDRNFGGFPGWSQIWETLSDNKDEFQQIENRIQNDNFLKRLLRFFGFGN